MFELTSVPHTNGGLVTSHGEYSTVRDCTVAARAIQGADPDRDRYFSAKDPNESFAVHKIFMSPGEFSTDIEIVLSNGKIVWLGDVDDLLCAWTEGKISF